MPILSNIKGELFDIKAEFVCEGSEEFGFVINGIPIVYNVQKNLLTGGENKAPLKPESGKIRMRILVDRVSIELYANDGRIYMPIRAYPDKGKKGLKLFSKHKNILISKLKIYKIKSIWK